MFILVKDDLGFIYPSSFLFFDRPISSLLITLNIQTLSSPDDANPPPISTILRWPAQQQANAKELFKQTLQGSQSSHFTHQLAYVSSPDVKDINKYGIIQFSINFNPQQPSYLRNDKQEVPSNHSYGKIYCSSLKRLYPINVNQNNYLNLNIKGIQGTQANICLAKSHFLDKRRQFRNYMQIQDLVKSNASSLKKGILTIRQTIILMPNQQFLRAKQQKQLSF